jgi:hypothetical protein
LYHHFIAYHLKPAMKVRLKARRAPDTGAGSVVAFGIG